MVRIIHDHHNIRRRPRPMGRGPRETGGEPRRHAPLRARVLVALGHHGPLAAAELPGALRGRGGVPDPAALEEVLLDLEAEGLIAPRRAGGTTLLDLIDHERGSDVRDRDRDRD